MIIMQIAWLSCKFNWIPPEQVFPRNGFIWWGGQLAGRGWIGRFYSSENLLGMGGCLVCDGNIVYLEAEILEHLETQILEQTL